MDETRQKAVKWLPKWFSVPAFLIAAPITALTLYPEAERLGFSNEALSQLVVGSVVSGVVWSAIASWFVRRYIARKP